MANIDKIIGEILEEAEKEARDNKTKADAEAKRILDEAKAECAAMEKEAQEKVSALKKSIEQRAKSSAQLKKRQEILKARQDIISLLLEKSYQSIFQMEEEQYFSFLERMLQKFVLPKEGSIYFSTKDLGRMPMGFEAKIQEIAAKQGGALELMSQGKEIDGGFVLVYGGVEENCSLRTIFHTQRDELADKIHAFLVKE